MSRSPLASPPAPVLVLATGGTIAGEAARPEQPMAYRAAQRGVAELIAAVPALAAWPLEAEQLAQVDSKDMGPSIWRPLLARLQAHLARPEAGGVVITHGTDTLEETAWLLHRLLAPERPVVLTAAMRPANALDADGPGNLLEAVRLAATPGVRGVLLALGGEVFGAEGLRKAHPQRLAAFTGGDAGPLARWAGSCLQALRPWPGTPGAPGLNWPLRDPGPALAGADWPRVELLCAHAGAEGWAVDALRAPLPGLPPLAGLVVAATGNGTLARPLEAALRRAQAAGLPCWRTSRCGEGLVEDPACPPAPEPPAPARARDPQAPLPVLPLSPWQARLEAQLALLAESRPG